MLVWKQVNNFALSATRLHSSWYLYDCGCALPYLKSINQPPTAPNPSRKRSTTTFLLSEYGRVLLNSHRHLIPLMESTFSSALFFFCLHFFFFLPFPPCFFFSPNNLIPAGSQMVSCPLISIVALCWTLH